MSKLNNTFSVFKAGKKIKPIIYNQIATYDNNGEITGYSYTGSIKFEQGDIPNSPIGATVNDYRLVTFVPLLEDYTSGYLPNRIFEVGGSSIDAFPREIVFCSPIQLGSLATFPTSSGNNPTGSRYKPTGSLGDLEDNGYTLYLETSLNLISSFNTPINYTRTTAVNIRFALQKSTNGGSNWVDLSVTPLAYFPVGQEYGFNVKLNYEDSLATTSSIYRVVAKERTDYPSGLSGIIQVSNNSYFKVTQYPSPNTGEVTKFWFTDKVSGLAISNLLYASKGSGSSIGLNDVYGQKQVDIYNSGFDPITLDFEPKIGDEIRFGGTEQQTYIITNVTQSMKTQSGLSGTHPTLTLVLNKRLNANVNTNYFLLRRYVEDSSNIIIETNKPKGQTSDGIIKPEFVTQEVKTLIDNYILGLTS